MNEQLYRLVVAKIKWWHFQSYYRYPFPQNLVSCIPQHTCTPFVHLVQHSQIFQMYRKNNSILLYSSDLLTYLYYNCILTGHHQHETTINNNTSDANDICDGDILVLRSISKVEAATCMLVVERLSSWMLKAQAVLALMLSACRKCSQNHFVCCLMMQKYFVHVMILVE